MSDDPIKEKARVLIDLGCYFKIIGNMQTALNLAEQAQVLMRPRPPTMRADDHALRELARAKLDTIIDLLRQALIPW